MVNYDQEKAKKWIFLDKGKKIQTRNFLIRTDKEFRVLDQIELDDYSWRNQIDRSRCSILGLEDCILFEHKDQVWFISNTSDTPVYRKPKQTIGMLPEKPIDGKYQIEKLQVLDSPHGKTHIEKNWLPFSSGNSISFIYYCKEDGVEIVKYSDQLMDRLSDIDQIDSVHQGFNYVDVQLEKKIRKDGLCFRGFKELRGSAGPIPFEYSGIEGWLMVTHEVVFRSNNSGGGRCYFHRFIFMDSEFSIQGLSRIFYFDHREIEFCRSMSYSHQEDEIILGVGIEDREARLYLMDIEKIQEMLLDLSAFQIEVK